MPDEEALVCEPPKRKKINWTPNACLNSTSHRTLLNIRGLQKDESAPGLDRLQLPISGTAHPSPDRVQTSRMPCKRFAIDDLKDHLHSCTHHAGATMGAHEHILTALQRLFTKAGYSRGMQKADLLIKDFQLAGVWDVIVDVTLRHEFRLMRQSSTQWGALTPRLQRNNEFLRQGEARQLPT
jgi:hypothetical protein